MILLRNTSKFKQNVVRKQKQSDHDESNPWLYHNKDHVNNIDV